ncbi:MAG: LuxR C-terminal-related transcriptional regulator [Spirochaetota bacterium]
MSKYTIIALLLSSLWAYLGTATLLNDYRNRVNALFCALCVSMIVWNFSGGLAYSISTLSTFILLSRISFIGFFLFFPLNLHFYLTVSRTDYAKKILLLNYAPAVILSAYQFADSFLFSSFIRYNSEWTGTVNYGSPWLYIAVLYFSAYSALSFFILLKWYSHTAARKERIYALSILVFFNTANAATVVSTFILPAFDLFRFQFAGLALFNLYVLCLFFLVAKFRFMSIVNPSRAHELISSMNDLVFILNTELTISEASTHGRFPAARRQGSVSYTALIKGDKALGHRLSALVRGKTDNFTHPVCYHDEGDSIQTNSGFHAIKDRFGDCTGVLVISNEIRQISRFRDRFRITERELEIIGLVIAGSSYCEVSHKLAISERTVERHLTNIYNKLGINNRIELYIVAEEYNIRA